MMFNPQQMEKLLRQMGIKTEQIEATKVIIETASGKLIIENPNVMKMVAKGQEVFQITGKVVEERFNEEDVRMVMEKANVSRERAEELLRKADGDVAMAIMLASDVADAEGKTG